MATPSDVGANPEGTGDLERGIEEMGLGGAEAEEGAAPPAPMVERPLPAFPRPARGDVLSIAPMMVSSDVTLTIYYLSYLNASRLTSSLPLAMVLSMRLADSCRALPCNTGGSPGWLGFPCRSGRTSTTDTSCVC